MIRARFKIYDIDYRPLIWPIPHPYWCSGEGDDSNGSYYWVVAYADSVEQILKYWSDAQSIGVMQEGLTEYTFTDRFAKPDWFELPAKKEEKE